MDDYKVPAGVHERHCGGMDEFGEHRQGCKYGDDNCPVRREAEELIVKTKEDMEEKLRLVNAAQDILKLLITQYSEARNAWLIALEHKPGGE